MENFATPNNTLGMSEPAPIDTNVPPGFTLGKNLSNFIKKKKNKKLIEYIKMTSYTTLYNAVNAKSRDRAARNALN